MTIVADYACRYETEIRLRRRGAPYLLVLLVWLGLLAVRPRLALEIWRERA